MQIYKAHKRQTASRRRCPQQNSVSSVTGGTPAKCRLRTVT